MHGYAALAEKQVNRDRRECEPVGLFHRSPPQLITANRETDFTAVDAGERKGNWGGRAPRTRFDSACPARYRSP